ncbi:RNA polymerase sigma factor [Thalassobacillus hwangdonensis]|uniref:RNA polymerase sigma factor n=1 Tax=Thalassobacillus hwangdonensis TaxID=546108 RepID=A0ABW3KZI2_9BACI
MTDEELLKEIQAGSEAALDVLIRRYYNEVYAYIVRRTRQEHLAYDLTQEVFTKMLHAISTLEMKKSLRGWLMTVALNHVRDYYRSKQAKTIHKERDLEEEIVKDSHPNVAYLFEKKETAREVQEAVHTLPDYQSEAIVLKYFHEFKINEIAAMTDTTESTVKSRLRQGMKKLAKVLRKGDEENEQRRT